MSSAQKHTTARPSPATGAGAPADTSATPDVDARTRRLVEKTIARLNGLMTETGERYDAIADHVFETFYDGDVQRALGPGKDAPVGFALLAGEADGTLRMSRSMLFQSVRIGALNRRFDQGPWRSLGWSQRLELLRLLGRGLSFDRVQAGATWATRTKASVRDLRAWVDKKLAEEAPQDGTNDENVVPLGPTFAAGRRLIDVGAAIGKAADRRRWVDRFLKLEPDAQRAYLAGVKATARNFEKLAQELALSVDDG
jgi:hypothetical protein